jgi:hypothetical protein
MLSRSCETFRVSLLVYGVMEDLVFSSSVMLFIFCAFLVPPAKVFLRLP